MAEKLTLKLLSGELGALHNKVRDLETQLERKLETTLEAAANKLKSRLESSNLQGHGTGIDTVRRQQMIAEEAYLIAERREFQGGDSAQDWIEAEQLVNHRLMQQSTPEKPVKRTTTKPAATKPAAKTSSSTR